MNLTRRFSRSAARQASVMFWTLTITALPFAAAAVSQADDGDRSEPAKGVATALKAFDAAFDSTKLKAEKPGVRNGQDNRSGVVAHWRFQHGTTGQVADSSQLIEDSSGNDRHGRAVGGPRYRAVSLPMSNLALAFDGHDDRIAIADDPLFHLTKSFTIEAYIQIDVYPESAAQECHIVFRGDNRLGFDPWFLSVTQSGQLRFLIADALNKASVVESPEPIPTGEFLHVAATLDDETGKQSLFINGKRVATTKTKIRAGGALGGSGAGIGIGNRQSHSNQAFRGTIDEVRISADALSPAQLLPPLKMREG